MLNTAEGSRFGQVDTGHGYYRDMPSLRLAIRINDRYALLSLVTLIYCMVIKLHSHRLSFIHKVFLFIAPQRIKSE